MNLNGLDSSDSVFIPFLFSFQGGEPELAQSGPVVESHGRGQEVLDDAEVAVDVVQAVEQVEGVEHAQEPDADEEDRVEELLEEDRELAHMLPLNIVGEGNAGT